MRNHLLRAGRDPYLTLALRSREPAVGSAGILIWYFAQVIGELLYWLGEDRLLFASDYAIWSPKWLVERFVDLQLPEDMASEYPELTTAAKRKILGLNAARLYGIEVPEEARLAETPPVTA